MRTLPWRALEPGRYRVLARQMAPDAAWRIIHAHCTAVQQQPSEDGA